METIKIDEHKVRTIAAAIDGLFLYMDANDYELAEALARELDCYAGCGFGAEETLKMVRAAEKEAIRKARAADKEAKKAARTRKAEVKRLLQSL